MLNTLRELTEKRQQLHMDFVAIQSDLQGADHAIKLQLIEMRATEVLTIQWGKLRRMVRK